MREQKVQSQFAVGGNAHFHLDPSSNETLEKLSKELRRIGGVGQDELVTIAKEFGNISNLDLEYIVPDLQDFNPPDEKNSPGLNVTREPAFNFVDRFVRRLNLAENGNRCLFILGDAGMGKTSLLVMLKYRHLTSFLPTCHDYVLLKLGPDTMDRIAAISNPANTVLLLDSLDEDPKAHGMPGGAQERLLELLPVLVRFHRTVITCRTQFFPNASRHLTTLAGHFVIDPYECPLKYLSLFTDEQVELYLWKRFRPGPVRQLLNIVAPWRFEEPRLIEARKAAYSMDDLRLRPLLLSRINDFVSPEGKAEVDFRNSYAVYHRLVDQWLMRDAPKLHGRNTDDGWRVATILALYLARQGRRQVPQRELTAINDLDKVPKFNLDGHDALHSGAMASGNGD